MSKLNENLCDRFAKVFEYTGLTQGDFAGEIGARQSDISQIIRKKAEPTKNHIISVIQKFNIDATWLLLGQGEMFKTDKRNAINETPATYHTAGSATLIQEIQQLKATHKTINEMILVKLNEIEKRLK